MVVKEAEERGADSRPGGGPEAAQAVPEDPPRAVAVHP